MTSEPVLEKEDAQASSSKQAPVVTTITFDTAHPDTQTLHLETTTTPTPIEPTTTSSTETTATATATAIATNTTMTINQEQLPEDESNNQLADDLNDNGIFDFMTPERAIELYKRIHSGGLPNLEWEFYGRRRLDELQESGKIDKQSDNMVDKHLEQQDNNGSLIQTEFDFDESFPELTTESSPIINDSLQLKNRPEPGSEKKTNLSDIMSHLMKEKSLTEDI